LFRPSLEKKPQISQVILHARWALSTTGKRYKQEDGANVQLIDLKAPMDTSRSNMELFEAGLRNTVETVLAMGKKVIIIASIPEVGFDVPTSDYSARFTGRDVNVSIAPTFEEYLQRVAHVMRTFTNLHSTMDVNIVQPWTALCENTLCKVTNEGIPLYRDDDHLSPYGAEYISSMFDLIFAPAEET
jgi:hypothetical protein